MALPVMPADTVTTPELDLAAGLDAGLDAATPPASIRRAARWRAGS